MIREDVLQLSDSDCFSSGTHRKVYRYPSDEKLLIKIAFNEDGKKDMAREMYVRNKLAKNDITSKILPAYHGMVKTNFGQGYIFEYIKDYNGDSSKTLEDYLQEQSDFERDYEKILRAILEFKQNLLRENIVIMDIFPINILLQRMEDGSLRPMFINDMGSAALIPLEYYIPALNRKRTLRRWQRFVQYIAAQYPSSKVAEFLDKIR